MPKANAARTRVVCITQGKDPIILAHQRGEELLVEEIPITPIEKEKVIDTNGAGDSFVGGFLSQIVQNKDLHTAVNAGIWLSGQVIQRDGCTFPEANTFA